MLEDMLQMYVMDNPSKQEYYFHLIEFTYNNGQQEALNMDTFEVFYGRKCITPVNWDGLVEKVILGLEMLKEIEQEVVKIRQNLKVA